MGNERETLGALFCFEISLISSLKASSAVVPVEVSVSIKLLSPEMLVSIIFITFARLFEIVTSSNLTEALSVFFRRITI